MEKENREWEDSVKGGRAFGYTIEGLGEAIELRIGG